MMFIVRQPDGAAPPLDIKMVRRTPAIVPDSAGRTDFFCVGDIEAAKDAGLPVVPVHDGWYADDTGGGVAVWGQGLFWEVRDTPFTVTQAAGPDAWPREQRREGDDVVNVRQAIFRG